MRSFGASLAVLLTLTLQGCGTTVPSIDPTYNDSYNNADFVKDVANSVYCELRQVVRDDYNTGDRKAYPWLYGWSAKIALTLTVDEKSGVSPAIQYLQPTAFALGFGGSLSSEGNRVFAITWYVLFSDLINGKPNREPCHKPEQRFIEGDLKIAETLNSILLLGRAGSNVSSEPYLNGGPFDSVTHHIFFEIDASGNLTPAWKYTNVTANQGGNFLTAARNRRDELLITMGPTQDVASGRDLVPIRVPANSVVTEFNNEQIGSAVRNAQPR